MKTLTKAIPAAPGVYFFKDSLGALLYVGKAKSLKSRVGSYFKKRPDWKVQMLIEEHAEVDFIVTKNETEALLLEVQMVQEHKPKFNALPKKGSPLCILCLLRRLYRV